MEKELKNKEKVNSDDYYLVLEYLDYNTKGIYKVYELFNKDRLCDLTKIEFDKLLEIIKNEKE